MRLNMNEKIPLVSIITPSYNKGPFIEETILSIKNQNYPNLEHIIIDGGSSDNSIEIIKKYHGTYNMKWVSEHDEGQSDAINKGWGMANGEILGYLNADDTYMPWTIESAVKHLMENPNVCMVYGDCNIINEDNNILNHHQAREFNLKEIVMGISAPTPTLIFHRELLNYVGLLEQNLCISWDCEFWLRVGLNFKVQRIPVVLTNFRFYPGTKCASESFKSYPERLYILNKLFSYSTIPNEIEIVRGQAYSYAYFECGISFLKQCQIGQALKALLKSFMLDPRYVLKGSGRVIGNLKNFIINCH